MNIGESQITPQVQAQITPDVLSPQGKQKLLQHLGKATTEKPVLDSILQALAKKIGADFSSRVKNPTTTVQKIAQKRLEGRKYDVPDINDALGARLIIHGSKQLKMAQEGISKLAKAGVLEILKKQDVKKDTYHAYHYDVKTPQGASAEIQIMTPQEELESVANHSLRSIYGEDPKNVVDVLKNKQAELAKNISGTKAKRLTATIKQTSQSPTGQPVDPRAIAAVMQQAKR